MRSALRLLGWLCVVGGVLLVIVGLAALPAGGLMFALPFFFLIPGIALLLLGPLVLLLTRRRRRPDVPADVAGPSPEQ